MGASGDMLPQPHVALHILCAKIWASTPAPIEQFPASRQRDFNYTEAHHAGLHKVGAIRPDAARAIAKRTEERATAFARAARASGRPQHLHEVLHGGITMRTMQKTGCD